MAESSVPPSRNPQASPVDLETDPETSPTEPELAKRAAAAAALAPTLSDEHQLLWIVHQGQHCDVWKGLDTNGRPLAIKLARSASAEAQERVTTEARAIASLTHRSIVRLRGMGNAVDGRPYLAFEWLEGSTLRRVLHARGAGWPPRDALRLLLPIASALLVAHDRGYIHGDVRAENVIVLFREDGHVVPKVIDFAAARRIHPTAPPPSANEPTRRLSAPADAGDPKTDIRGLASTIFYAIAGRAPFSKPPEKGASPFPRTGLSEREAVLWRILAEAMAPPSAMRFETVNDFARELAAWAELHGVDVDITGAPISVRWQGASRS